MKTKKYVWNPTLKIKGGEISIYAQGEKELSFPFEGGPCVSARNPHSVTCVGCKHLGFDKYGNASCAHPETVKLWGCPQHHGKSPKHPAHFCPEWHAKSKRVRRLLRIRNKLDYIFWDYFGTDDNDTEAYRQGFRPLRGFVRTRCPVAFIGNATAQDRVAASTVEQIVGKEHG